MDFQKTCDDIVSAFGTTCDLRTIDLNIGEFKSKFLYIDGYIDTLLFEENILKPLKNLEGTKEVTLSLLNETTMMTTPIEQIDEVEKAVELIASGEIILVAENSPVMFKYYPNLPCLRYSEVRARDLSKTSRQICFSFAVGLPRPN